MKRVKLLWFVLVTFPLLFAKAQGGCTGKTLSTDIEGAKSDFCNNCYWVDMVVISNPVTGENTFVIYAQDC